MQDDTSEEPTSISQLLRESYLAETRTHQNYEEPSKYEPSSDHFYYTNVTESSADVGSSDDFLDLSAFLSEEELDKSVNLAREAIDQTPRETKQQEKKIRVKQPSKSTSNKQVPKPVVSQASSDKGHTQSFRRENVIRGSKSSKESTQDAKKTSKNSPYGCEAEAKKEFLNKAADFIEELSSLFKSQSSKRIRPKALKDHRKKYEAQLRENQPNNSTYPYISESRERAQVSIPEADLNEPESPVQEGIQQTEQSSDQEEIIEGEEEQPPPSPPPSPPSPPPSPPSPPPPPPLPHEVMADIPAESFEYEEFKGMPPVFIQRLKSREVLAGSKVQLDCIVEGNPAPDVRWYCEGKELENSPDIQIITSGQKHSLVIAEAFEEDTGRYSCFASNLYGSDSTSAEIYIEGVSSSDSEGEAQTEDMPQLQRKTEPSVTTLPPSSPAFIHQEVHQSTPIPVQVVSPLPEQQNQSPTNYLQGFDGRPLIAAPVFTKMLQDLTASEGQLVVLESRVKGAPSPKVEWYREGTLIEDSPDFRILQKKPRSAAEPEEICTLVIAEVFPEDSGTFTCTASNKYGTVSSIARLTVKGADEINSNAPKALSTVTVEASHHQLPPILPPSKPQNIPAPEIPSSPKPKLEGVLVNHNEPRSSSKAGLRVHFQLPEDDKGSEASSEEGITSVLQLRSVFDKEMVNGQPLGMPTPTSPTKEPPPVSVKPKLSPHSILKKTQRFSQFLSEEDIRDSKDAVIHDLERKLKFRDEVSLPNGQQKVITEDTMARRYLGPNYPSSVFNAGEAQNNPYPSQDLKYEIESTRNTLGKQQEYKVSSFEQRLMSEIEFRLERTPVEESDDEIQHDDIPKGKCIAPIFDKRLKHFRVTEGTPITFTCKVVGIPVPKVYWFKDGKQISKKNPHCVMKREGDGTCSLSIEACTNDDDGNYTIMAANPQGRISCSGHLMVQSAPLRSRLAPAVQSHRVRTRPTQGEELETVQERFFRPHFLQAPGDMVANEGRLCRLDCKVSGLPTPDLMWLLNGKPLLPGANHKMLVRENGVHSLLIDPLTQNDAGTYTCIATNKAGQSSFNLELTVAAKEVKKAPIFLEKLQNTGIPEGHAVRLECRVVGMPPPVIYWKKDNDTISAHRERVSLFQDATGYVCLMIQPTRKEDAGWYTVSAKNEAGIVSCTARLDIYAQWHQQIPQPVKKVRPSGSRYAALTGQGLDILSAFPSADNPTVHTSFDVVESEEL
ncbi:myopalladin isoform X5 [Protopterus annectens]|uniref:myopalladin isoform X5 n=1 Tax=Protopterus annectens TaxID=7888 RepID=UPI001CF9D15B|nr:myopalladin isoform X5 [Protopterus annectens]